MYRIKLKNKSSGEIIVAWEFYDKQIKNWAYSLDLYQKERLDINDYEALQEEERYNDKLPFTLFGIECGKGWFSLIEPIINYIDGYNKDKENPDEQIEILQIKEKYGTLRIYTSFGNDELFRMIDEAERESEHVCEFCGSRENIGETQGYYMTCCRSCVKEMAIEGKRSYKWLDFKDNKIYWIYPDKDDEFIEVFDEKELP